MKRHFDQVDDEGGHVFTHADLVHDMRVAIARVLDPLSAYTYARVNKENYFLIVGSSVFNDSDRTEKWDGTRIVRSGLEVTWLRLALAPAPYFKKCVKNQENRHFTSYLMRTYFTCVLLVTDDVTPDFRARFESLVDAAKRAAEDATRTGRALSKFDADLLDCAIGWGNYPVAEYIAAYPDIEELGLAKTKTLEAWRSRDYLELGCLLAEAQVNHTYVNDPYLLVKEARGTVVPLLSQFERFCHAVGHPHLFAFCSSFWKAKKEDWALVVKPIVLTLSEVKIRFMVNNKYVHVPFEELAEGLPDTVALVARHANTRIFSSATHAHSFTTGLLKTLLSIKG